MKKFWNEVGSKMKKADYIFLGILIIAYGILAFTKLGDTKMPQTYYEVKNETIITFDLENEKTVSKVRVFSGSHDGTIEIYGSTDGEDFNLITTKELEYVFTWYDVDVNSNLKYFMIQSSNVGTTIGDLQLYDENNDKIEMTLTTIIGEELVDETDLVPEKISYMNSMYFDEIYFGRTAYDYAKGLTAYEWVHPPLGKLIQAIPIKLFGMSPFTYRFMGTFAGILLICVMYLFAKELFGKRKYAILAALLMTFDNFHFAQSRMGTMDTHLVLFILLAFYFMFRYMKCDKKVRQKKKLWNLCFSGFFIGCAIATKWTGFFGGLGLAILFFTHFIKNRNVMKKNEKINTILSCIIFFVLIPVLIYLLSYFLFPKLQPYTVDSFSNLWKQTEAIYEYHSTLTETHPFSSPWYTWSMMIKPVWYYVSYLTETTRETISGIGNPMIWWVGTVAMIYLLVQFLLDKKTKEKYTILIAILTLWLPYIFIGRIMFMYHFFPVVPFMMLSIVSLLKELIEKKKGKWVLLYMILVVVFFALFFPVSSGIEISNNYLKLIRWASTWTF